MAYNTPLKTGIIRPSKAPNLPIAPVEYSQQYQDQFTNALRLYFAQVDNTTADYGALSGYANSYVEAYDRTASIAIPNTPTLLKPASFSPATASGITYDPATGVFTFLYSGTYTLAISLNITTTTANQHVYIYAQKNTGSGWVNTTNSGKEYDLVNGDTVQYQSPQAVYRAAGEQTRYYLWSNGTTSSLVTQTLPTVTPTVYVPAIRIQFA
jgi:hypothetical protein